MKMRNKLYSILALCGMVLVSACGDHETPTFTDSFISFKGGSITRSESDPAFEILITASSEGATSGISLGGSATEGVDYNISSTTVTTGSDFTTTITVTPIDNLVIDGTQTIEITLTDGGFPGGADGKVYTVTLLDDDCPAEVSATYAGTGRAFNADTPEWSATLTAVGGTDNQWTVNSLWGPDFVGWATGDAGFNGRFIYAGTITYNATDRSVAVAGDAGWATGGTGTYDTCNDVFTFTLTQGLFQSDFTVDVTLTGNGD